MFSVIKALEDARRRSSVLSVTPLGWRTRAGVVRRWYVSRQTHWCFSFFGFSWQTQTVQEALQRTFQFYRQQEIRYDCFPTGLMSPSRARSLVVPSFMIHRHALVLHLSPVAVSPNADRLHFAVVWMYICGDTRMRLLCITASATLFPSFSVFILGHRKIYTN